MKIIDGTGVALGRLASFVSKSALKGEEIIVVNCKEIILTGRRKDIEQEYKDKKSKVGTTFQGPKHSKDIEKIVKRTIRGMLPNPRGGRGKETLKKIRCYKTLPIELEKEKITKMKSSRSPKKIKISEVYRK
jgi:large subunit ribosomal protein L13